MIKNYSIKDMVEDMLNELEQIENKGTLQDIITAPKNGTYILVAGKSGYKTTPLQFDVCRYDSIYHPLAPWINYSNKSIEFEPLYWMPLPSLLE